MLGAGLKLIAADPPARARIWSLATAHWGNYVVGCEAGWCYPYQSVFYFCFHWKLDINGSYAIPLVSDTGERLQWNLTPVKSLFILPSIGNTHTQTNRPYCFFNSILALFEQQWHTFILFPSFPQPPPSIGRRDKVHIVFIPRQKTQT